MKKILCIGYRSWALKIYKNIKKIKKYKVLIISNKKYFNKKRIYKFYPDVILFYGDPSSVAERKALLRIIRGVIRNFAHTNDMSS